MNKEIILASWLLVLTKVIGYIVPFSGAILLMFKLILLMIIIQLTKNYISIYILNIVLSLFFLSINNMISILIFPILFLNINWIKYSLYVFANLSILYLIYQPMDLFVFFSLSIYSCVISIIAILIYQRIEKKIAFS